MSKDLGKLLREKLEAQIEGNMVTAPRGGKVNWGRVVSPTTWEIPPDPAMEEVRYMLDQIDYILQRTVLDYDELVKQYRAIKDIEEAGK